MLIALIPLIQFFKERRVSLVSIVILIVPPLLWFYISWKATGNWLACFAQRQEYHDWLLRANPAIAQFSMQNLLRDGATLLVSSDVVVLLASFVGGWFVVKSVPRLLKLRTEPDEVKLIFAPVLFFFAFFALLVVAYFTHQQPIIFPRYGLILFTLGLPVLAWTILQIREHHPRVLRRVLVGVVVICACNASIQLAGAVGVVNQYRAQRTVADYLRDHFDPKSNSKIFCDDGTVQVLSGIPMTRFVTSANSPTIKEGFIEALGQRNVELLIVTEKPDSTAYKLFPNFASGEKIHGYDLLSSAEARFLSTHIKVYRRAGSD
jgi:hypothetical protein